MAVTLTATRTVIWRNRMPQFKKETQIKPESKMEIPSCAGHSPPPLPFLSTPHPRVVTRGPPSTEAFRLAGTHGSTVDHSRPPVCHLNHHTS